MPKAVNMSKAANQEASIVDAIVSSNIRATRIQRGLTQQQLADLIGVTYQQAHKYELAINRVSAGRLVVIARALNVSPADLLPGGEPVPISNRERMALEIARNFNLLAGHEQEAISALIARIAQGAPIGKRDAA